MQEIEKTEKERIKKKGRVTSIEIGFILYLIHSNGLSFVGLKLLKNSGVMDAYQYLLTSLCKYGLPTGDLYEFSAL